MANGDNAPDFIPDEELESFTASNTSAPDFIPDDEISSFEDQQPSTLDYIRAGAGSQPVKAAVREFGNLGSFGFGDELGGLQEAQLGLLEGIVRGRNAFGDEGRLAAIQNFYQNYQKAKSQLQQEREFLSEENPIAAATGGLTGALAGGGLTSVGLKGAGLASQGAQAAVQGGLAGLGTSDKESVTEAVLDTATGAGLGFLFQKGFNKLLGPSSKAIQQKDGSYKIKYGKGSRDAFDLSAKQAQSLNDPNTQAAITAQLEAQKEGLKGAINQNMKRVSEAKIQALAEYGDRPVKGVETAFKDIFKAIDDLSVGTDDTAAGLKNDLRTALQQSNEALLKGTGPGIRQGNVYTGFSVKPTTNYNNISMKALDQEREALGKKIFQDKLFSERPKVDRLAVQAWDKLKNILEDADYDPVTKQAGEVAKSLKAQKALFDVRQVVNKTKVGNWIKGLSDPQNGTANTRLKELTQPLTELNKQGLGGYVGDVQKYLNSDFADAVHAAQVMRMVSGRGLEHKELGASLFSLAGLKQAVHGLPATAAAAFGGNIATRVPTQAFLATGETAGPLLSGAGAPSLNQLIFSTDENQ